MAARQIAGEGLGRVDEEKTPVVHLLRFESSPEQIDALQDGAELTADIDREKPARLGVAQHILLESLRAEWVVRNRG